MSIAISANLAGTKLLDLTCGGPRERENDAAMSAQNAATEAQSEGLKPQNTMLDQLRDRPSVLDRFAD